MSNPIIQVRQLDTQFGTHVIHHQLDLDVVSGEIIALIGGSGTGKTTLMREIVLLEKPKAGSVKLFGKEVLEQNERQTRWVRQRCGVMFQQGALFGALTVAQNVAVPLQEHTKLSAQLIDEIARLKIALAGLPPEAGDKFPAQLSGGMVKRAALARALALDPDILFLDEPTAGLDPIGAGAFDELILSLKNLLGLTVVIVTHDLDSLWRVTDRIAVLADQNVVATAPITELIQIPHTWIQAYFNGPRGRATQGSYPYG